MIRRHPPRQRGQHQDFHFFAAGDPTAHIESQFTRAIGNAPPQQPLSNADPPPPAFTQRPSAPHGAANALPPAASSAIRESIDFLENVNDPRELIGKPRPAFMDQIDALSASPRNAASEPTQAPVPSKPPSPRRSPKPRALSSSAPKSIQSSAPPSADRHERRCSICSHPDRADIEADFIEWAAPSVIAREYGVSRIAVYRHARAAGLFARRDRNLRFALGRIIEHVGQVWPTPDSIVRAIHAFARINDQGQWVEPPAHVIVSSGGVRREAAVRPSRRPIAIQLDSPVIADVTDAPSDPAPSPAPASGTPQPHPAACPGPALAAHREPPDSGAMRAPLNPVLIDTPERLECDVSR